MIRFMYWCCLLILPAAVLCDLDGTLLSTSPAQSCATIYDSSGGSKMQCNQATVMQLELLPDNEGGAIQFLFQNNGQQQAGGGPGTPVCDNQNPGTCVGGEPFYVNVQVSKLLVSYPLDLVGLEVPFGYAYSSTVTRSAGHGKSTESSGPYPDDVLDQCGPTVTYNLQDFTQCNQIDEFAANNQPEIYSECIMMSSVDKSQAWKSNGGDYCSKTLNNLTADYRRENGVIPDREHLTCKEINYESSMDACMPNFPNPVSLCPCAGGYDTVTSSQGTMSVVPITVCKSGTCAGTCGSAITVSPGGWCGGQDPSSCCNITDPNSICINTNQQHRCLKCQPMGSQKDKKHYCYYLDLHIQFRCGWTNFFTNPTGLDLTPWCGSGDYVSGGWFDPTYNDADSLRYRDARECNCDADFLEIMYPVAPLCNTYVIRNPPRFEYTVTVSFTDLDGNYIPGSTMVTGSGWSSNNTYPPSNTLPQSQYTPDGFALTRILSTDSSTGKKTTELNGFIVMCNNGNNPACTVSMTNITKSNLPTSNIQTSQPDGRTNPWDGGYFTEDEAKVPLPDMVFRYANVNFVDPNNPTTTSITQKEQAAWWYYVPEINTKNYGRGCGQVGMFPNGDSDPATANTMCNGPIGTCIPGVDTLMTGSVSDPPCNVAADFYHYVKAQGGTYSTYQQKQAGSTSCPEQVSSKFRIKPPHVPLDWDPVTPQYWVHAGRLFKENDANVASVSIRTTLSIAADFIGEVITQAPGTINAEPQQCVLYVDSGTGALTVSVNNLGTQSAQYILRANCTEGIIMANADGLTFSQGPGVGGSSNTQVLLLSVETTVQLTPTADEAAAGDVIPSCNALLYPSGVVIQDRPMSTANNIPCIVSFGWLPTNPNGEPPHFGEAIGQYVPVVQGSTCGIFTPLCYLVYPHRQNFFSPLQILIITVFVAIFIVFFFMYVCQSGLVATQMELEREDGVRKALEGTQVRSALYNANKNLTKEKESAEKEEEK